MAFAQLEAATGHCEMVVFPRTFKQAEATLQASTVVFITGSLAIDATQQCKIKANSILPLNELLASPQVKEATLSLPGSINAQLIEEIKKVFTPGTMTCTLRYNENNETLQLTAKSKIGLTLEAVTTLKKLGVTTHFELK